MHLNWRLITTLGVAIALSIPGLGALGRAQNSNQLLAPLHDGSSSDSGGLGLSDLTSGGVSSTPPSLKVVNPTFDFGKVFQGTAVKHTFRLENAGAGPLIIGAVQTSCGCTVAQPTKKLVQPGDYSEIAATFDTTADKGPAQRIITVQTNDPLLKQLKLTLKGDVKVKVDANPSPVVFDKVKHGAEVSRAVLVTDMMNTHDFRISSISNSSHDLKVTQAARTDGKPGASLTLTLLKSAPAATFSDIVKLATSEGPLNIPVWGNVVGDLNVTPPQVSFGIVKRHEGALRFARLTNAGERPLKVTGVSTNNVRVAATVEPIAPGKEFKLTLQLQPNSPDGTLRGAVAIQTDDPAQPVVEVPFYGIVGTFNG